MRVVSLVPAGTEIAAAIGATDELVAVTHDCDHPPSVRALPRITRSTIPVGAGSRAIDTAVRAAAERGESTFHLDAAALAAARPDVLLGQTLCHVCAVTVAELPANVSPEVVPLDGGSLEGIFADIARVGVALRREDAANALIAASRERIAQVERRVKGAARPTVVCLEWLDPLFNAGHWVPEQVAAAGGRDLLGTPGVPSLDVDFARVADADPDYVVLMPCGFGLERGIDEAKTLRADPRWRELRAVRDRRAYAVDGSAYFSRPGPRVVDGIELLASILHADRVSSDIAHVRL